MQGFARVLVPTDFSSAALRGVVRGADIARSFHAKALLLFVVEKSFFAPLAMIHQAPVTFGGEGDLLGEAVEDGEKRLKALAAEHFQGVECAAKVVVAVSSASGILDQAETFAPDLVVISAQGRSAVERLLLGSTTEKVVRHSTCEVLVVRGR